MIFTSATEIFVYSLQALGAVQYRVWVRMLFEPGLSILLALVFLGLDPGLVGATRAFLLPIVIGVFLGFLFLKKIFAVFLKKEIVASIFSYAILLVLLRISQEEKLILGKIRLRLFR